MRLTDLQWEIRKVLNKSSLTPTEVNAVQVEINQLIEKFGKKLIEGLGVVLNDKR